MMKRTPPSFLETWRCWFLIFVDGDVIEPKVAGDTKLEQLFEGSAVFAKCFLNRFC
jgi:hypothetical protein